MKGSLNPVRQIPNKNPLEGLPPGQRKFICGVLLKLRDELIFPDLPQPKYSVAELRLVLFDVPEPAVEQIAAAADPRMRRRLKREGRWNPGLLGPIVTATPRRPQGKMGKLLQK